MERLCRGCRLSGKVGCDFKILAQDIADAHDMTPEKKHELIAKMRIKARDKNCPKLNEVDPHYSGRDKL